MSHFITIFSISLHLSLPFCLSLVCLNYSFPIHYLVSFWSLFCTFYLSLLSISLSLSFPACHFFLTSLAFSLTSFILLIFFPIFLLLFLFCYLLLLQLSILSFIPYAKLPLPSSSPFLLSSSISFFHCFSFLYSLQFLILFSSSILFPLLPLYSLSTSIPPSLPP